MAFLTSIRTVSAGQEKTVYEDTSGNSRAGDIMKMVPSLSAAKRPADCSQEGTVESMPKITIVAL